MNRTEEQFEVLWKNAPSAGVAVGSVHRTYAAAVDWIASSGVPGYKYSISKVYICLGVGRLRKEAIEKASALVKEAESVLREVGVIGEADLLKSAREDMEQPF